MTPSRSPRPARVIPLSAAPTLRAARELDRDAQLLKDRADALRRLEQRQRLDNYIAREQLREAREIVEHTSMVCVRVARDCREVANG